MLPDILGFKLSDALKSLNENGISSENIVLSEYFSPKGDIMGNDIRVIRVDKKDSRILLLTSKF